MAQEALVQEFRDIVTGAINQQVRNAFGTWSRMNEEAHVNDLVFMSTDPRKGALEPFPLDREAEHLWGIAPDRVLRVGGYTGRVAIYSLSNQPGLYRGWAVRGAMQSSPRSVRELVDAEIEPIVAWARSPHLHHDNFLEVAALTEAEQTVIDSKLEAAARQSEVLRQQLEDIERASRPGPDWNTTIIG